MADGISISITEDVTTVTVAEDVTTIDITPSVTTVEAKGIALGTAGSATATAYQNSNTNLAVGATVAAALDHVNTNGLNKNADTTSDLTEGTNLYYTTARFDTAFDLKSTSNLTEGSNLYYTTTRFDTAFAGKSTSNLTEGTNLYYTDARADARIAAASIGDLSNVDITTTAPTNNQILVWNTDKFVPADQTEERTIDFADLGTTPTTITGYGITDAFDGQYSSLAGKPTLYSDSAVDTHLNQSTAADNEVLSWNGSDYDWVAQSGGIALTDISVSGTEGTALGDGGIAYNNSTGVFTYTPPDLSSYLTSAPVTSVDGNTGDVTTLQLGTSGTTAMAGNTALSAIGGSLDLASQVTGTLPVGNMAATALTTVQTAADQAAQLALTTEEGDVVVRTDENKTYMRNSGTTDPHDMSNFTLLATPTDAVTSVDGNTGAVTTLQIGTSATTALVGNTTLADLGGQASLTFGIADTNAVKVDHDGVADDDYAKFTDNGIEGRSADEVKTDLSLNNVENTAVSTFAGTSNITTVGTVSTGTWQGTAIADAYISSATTWDGKQDALTFGIADDNAVEIDDTDAASGNYARFTANGIEGRATSDVLSDIGAQASLTFGIADDNAVEIDDTDVTSTDYARFTANGLEGRSADEVKTDLSLNNVENTAISTFAGSANITTVGTVTSGTWQGTAIADAYISSAGTWNGKQDALTFGIANTNAVKIDAADVADDEYARFTASGIESRSTAEVLSDIGAQPVLTEGAFVDGDKTKLDAVDNDTPAFDSVSIDTGTSTWEISESGNKLIFKYGGTSKMTLDSSGNLKVTGNITAFGTI